MNENHIRIICDKLGLQPRQVRNTLELLSQGATVPFISRYRKEMTESLDEVQVAAIKEQYNRLEELEKRRKAVLDSIEEQGKLDEDLKARILAVYSMAELEDLYLPFRQKRRTRAMMARERGLEPLASVVLRQNDENPVIMVQKYLSDQVPDAESALLGARDIIAEWVSEHLGARKSMRQLFSREAHISSKVIKSKQSEADKYRDYFEFSELVKRCPSHRLLAMYRGEEEGFLSLSVMPDESKALALLYPLFVKRNNPCGGQVQLAVKDSYKRLLGPSLETEARAVAKSAADDEAINVFADNLRQLLLAPPLGQKNVLAIDPGFRTGCKVVCLNAQGDLLHNETIYPHPPQSEVVQATRKVMSLIEAYKIEAIAIGNGTGGRETERFMQRMVLDKKVQVFVVNESGASIYSASAVAREEFPEYDITVRGAVSIGRRLMDPLAELVKIDAKSIGVGQYQHDVDQGKLKSSLDGVVELCVNSVGVNVNTASKHILTYVSGLGPQLARNIVEYRRENGPFLSRQAVMKVPRMGEKAFEQCAGFLRIPASENPLDNSAVHPESYVVVLKMAAQLGSTVAGLMRNPEDQARINIQDYVTDSVGLPTLMDILSELAKPGRDPRSHIEVFEFAEGIRSMEDLQPGMELPGIVTNITNFGCFVDVGIKQDGLVHISQLADRFVKHPSEVVKLNQHVQVRVVEVDVARRRIQFSMKSAK